MTDRIEAETDSASSEIRSTAKGGTSGHQAFHSIWRSGGLHSAWVYDLLRWELEFEITLLLATSNSFPSRLHTQRRYCLLEEVFYDGVLYMMTTT